FSNSDVELALFRITQEQLNNILRHARATEVTIDLTVTEKNIELTICDNGIGFDINSTKRGLGLNNMLNRAEFYHGKAIIESSPGNGCVLHVIFPVN
ncbi:MAG: histidine kinase, partial [Bacteroidetes bacterium]|nr:histidine kinase [Bacteroidota bacterium]